MMRSLKDIFKLISLDLGRGRIVQATGGIVDGLKALEARAEAAEARLEAIEARNRAKDCICKERDANGEFEIVKRIKESPMTKTTEVVVGEPKVKPKKTAPKK